MRFKLLIILLFVAVCDALGQGNSIYGVAPMPVCWTTPENVDSNLIAYWILSGREAAPRVVSYIEADGTLAVVSGGTLQNGFCCCNSSQDTIGITINGDTLVLVQNGETYTYIGGGGADDDWRWVDPGADETMYEAIYRMGKVSIFTEDTTHALRLDSTYRFTTDAGTSFFEWLRGTEGFVDYKTLMFRAPGGATGAPQNDANNITIARTNATTTRTNLGNLKFAAPYTGGGGAYRVGAQISALDELGGNDTTGVVLDFWTRKQGESFIRNTMTLEGDGRLELDRYNLFEDGVPERMLGYDDTDKDVKVSNIEGTPQAGFVLGTNDLNTGMKWIDPSFGGRSIYTDTGTVAARSDFLVRLREDTTFSIGFTTNSGFEDFWDNYLPGEKFDGFYYSPDYWGDVGIMQAEVDNNTYQNISIGLGNTKYIKLNTETGNSPNKSGANITLESTGSNKGGIKFSGETPERGGYNYTFPITNPDYGLGKIHFFAMNEDSSKAYFFPYVPQDYYLSFTHTNFQETTISSDGLGAIVVPEYLAGFNVIGAYYRTQSVVSGTGNINVAIVKTTASGVQTTALLGEIFNGTSYAKADSGSGAVFTSIAEGDLFTCVATIGTATAEGLTITLWFRR